MKILQIADKEYDLWILYNRVYHMIAKLRKMESLKFKILPTQSYFLFIIKALGNETTPTELSRYVYQQTSSISDILRRMEKLGLITKTRKSGEKRRVIVKLTEKGEEALRLSANRERLHNVMSSLTEEKMRQLETCLETLRDSAIKELNLFQKKHLPPSQISKYYLDKNIL